MNTYQSPYRTVAHIATYSSADNDNTLLTLCSWPVTAAWKQVWKGRLCPACQSHLNLFLRRHGLELQPAPELTPKGVK